MIRKYSATGRDFYPQDLDSSDIEKRVVAREIVMNFFKDAVPVSNSSLLRNANILLTSGNAKINPDEQVSWIENLVNENRRDLLINFLFRGIKEAADLPKILFFEYSANVLVFGVSLLIDF